MAQYTTELRSLVEQNFDLGLSNYPIFDEKYRTVLNQKIIGEYYFREIGQETPARFKHYLNHTLNMIMPYYNKLYETELLTIDPLITFSQTEAITRDEATKAKDTQSQTTQAQSEASRVEKDSNVGKSINSGIGNTKTTGTDVTGETGNQDTTENGLSVDSDTPGGLISLGDLKSNTWASSATMKEGTTGVVSSNDKTNTVDNTVAGTTSGVSDVTGSGTRNASDTGTQTGSMTGLGNRDVTTLESWIKTKTGLDGNQSELLMKYRKTILNIDQQVVWELRGLFMGVF